MPDTGPLLAGIGRDGVPASKRERARKFDVRLRRIAFSRVHCRRTETHESSDIVMVVGLGNAAAAAPGTPPAATARHAASSVASLDGQIRQDKIQLDDWATCVSSKTPKGQAQIQRLSGAISAAREQEQRIAAAPGSIDVWV